MKQKKHEVDLPVVDRNVGEELARLKHMILRLDEQIRAQEQEGESVEQELRKVQKGLAGVTAALNENAEKYNKCEENNKQIVVFFEKLVENTKSLAGFIERQNCLLEGAGEG